MEINPMTKQLELPLANLLKEGNKKPAKRVNIVSLKLVKES
jgi:hypothetical protein